MSTIHSVRKAKLPTKEQDDSKAEAKSPTEPESAVPLAAQPVSLPAEPPSEQPTAATQPHRKQRLMSTAEILNRGGGVFYGFYRDEPRPRFEDEYKSTPHLSSVDADFEGIRLATRIGIHEVTSSEGYLTDQQSRSFKQYGPFRYLYDPFKDNSDFFKTLLHTLDPPRKRPGRPLV